MTKQDNLTELEILRDSEIKLTIWGTIINNGMIRTRTGGLLLNADKVAPGDWDRIKIDADTGTITPEVMVAAIRMGDNGNGLVARVRRNQ